MPEIKKREQTAIINSLRAGVVPNIGLQHIQVGRKREIEAILKDLENVREGSSQLRFIVGDYGSGKSFFLNLAKAVAHEKEYVVFSADVTTDRIFSSSGGKSRALFSELVKNATHKSKPENGALRSIIDRWITLQPGLDPSSAKSKIFSALKPLEGLVSSFDFCEVIAQYYLAYHEGNDVTMAHCLKWLCAEYEHKTAARGDLGVTTIIDDDNFYDYLKLYAQFFRLSGFSGLLVCLDELAVLNRLHAPARAKNYEALLSIFNNCLQGTSGGYLFLLGGTPEFIFDKYKGLHSYGALASRLAVNPFETAEGRDLSGPLIALDNLKPEELFVLFLNIRSVFASYDPLKYLIDDAGIREFLTWCTERMGAKAFLSPRESIKWFVQLLSMVEQNPGKTWRDFLGRLVPDKPDDGNDSGSQDLANLKL